MKVLCCLITAIKPACVTKEFSLVNGELDKKTTASISKGRMQIQEIHSAHEFSKLLLSLQHNQCLTYGVPPHDAGLVTDDAWKKLGKPDDPLARTLTIFAWPKGSGVMMLDYDAPKDGGKPMGRKKLITALMEACPSVKESDLIWWPSTSSHIYSGETEINGLKGQRIYLFVKDASDIERAGDALNERLWSMGHGRFEVSSSGSLLKRSVFDKAVWQSNHIDFASGAKCAGGLEQRRGEPIVVGDSEAFNLLDTHLAIPELTPDELSRAQFNQDQCKKSLAKISSKNRSDWTSEKIKAIKEYQPNLDDATVNSMVRRACDSRVLTGDWKIIVKDDEGSEKEITVLEALDNPNVYNGRITLDPLEPDYDGRRWVGKLFLNGSRQNLHSFAHGAINYRLHRIPARIEIVTGKGRETTDALLDILRISPDIFDFGEEIVQVGQYGVLFPLNENSLRYVVGGLCQFWQWQKFLGGVALEVLRDPPVQVCKNVIALHSQRQLKKLTGVITAPTLRPDGTVIDRLGFDEKTKLLYDSNVMPPSIPMSPTREQACAALEYLWAPFSDFPFCGPLDRAVHLAALLTTAVRSALSSSPGIAYDAPIQGSGKTLLARCIGVLIQGTDPSIWPHTAGRDDEEVRKRIFTVLRTGSRILIWDNVVGTFDSPAMAACMTSPTFSDRILGQSNSSTVPNRLMVVLTGNNITLQGEMPRRVLVSRIDPNTDKPFARSFNLNPYAYCLENRQCMLVAALTLIRSYLTFGCQTQIHGQLASFEDWDKWVRRTVIYANELKPGMFGDVMDVVQTNQATDPDQEALSSLLLCWEEEFGAKAITVSELLRGSDFKLAAHRNKLIVALEALTNTNRYQLSAKSVGRYLAYRKDRIAGGRCLRKGPKVHDTQTWRVEVVDTGG